MRGVPGGLNAGVSLFVRKGGQSLWENGIFQNCLFLVMLLRRIPGVKAAFIVAGGGDGSAEDAARMFGDAKVPVIDLDTAERELDLMIEMSAQLPREWVVAFRERGAKVVSMRVGNDYVIDIERMIFDKPSGLLLTGAPYDAVWTLPQYESTCVPYFTGIFRAPVSMLPHLWSPVVIDQALARAGQASAFGYVPGRPRWRAGIFEPNICMVKTSHISLLGCEVAHRSDPQILEHVYAYNTFGLKESPSFKTFALDLDIVQHGIASFEARAPTWQALSSQVDAVVSHQWENAQNYLYYEVLHGGYPLVHNSHLLGDCGYRYEGFDCEGAGRALMSAFKHHDETLQDYRARARAFLATLDPEAPDNVRAYSNAVERLFD